MATLTKYQRTLLNTPIAIRVAYLVSRQKPLSQIIRSVLELSSRTLIDTIKALYNWFKSLGTAGKKVNTLPVNKPIPSAYIPTLTSNITTIRIGTNVDATLNDDSEKRFNNFYFDIPPGTNIADILQMIRDAFDRSIGIKYEIKNATFIITTIQGF